MRDNNNEIDLIELLVKLYMYIKKYIWVLVVTLSVGIIFSFIKTKVKQPIYSSTMVIESKIPNEYMYTITLEEIEKEEKENPGEIIVQIVKTINSFRYNGQSELLAKRMELNVDQIKEIRSVNAVYNLTKTDPINNLITVNAEATNPETFKYLGKGIINYINNNNYIKSKYVSDSIFLSNLLEELDQQTDQFNKTNSPASGTVNTFKLKNKNKSDQNQLTDIIVLTALKEKIKGELTKLKKTKIIEDFYIPIKHKSNLKLYLINIILSLIIGISIIFFLIIRLKYKSFKNNKIEN